MTTRKLATTAGWLVAVAACSVAGLTAWLLVTSPTSVALAVQAGNSQPLAQLALQALYQALGHLTRYL